MRYSVFCLGDTRYEHFCKFGIDLEERLQAPGGTRFIPRAESDVDVAHGREVHCTIALVRYRSQNRERGASTMLADRVDVGRAVPIYIQPNKKFRLPTDTGTPMIMILPGHRHRAVSLLPA